MSQTLTHYNYSLSPSGISDTSKLASEFDFFFVSLSMLKNKKKY